MKRLVAIVTVMLSLLGVTQAWAQKTEGPWTTVKLKYGTTDRFNTTPQSYTQLNGQTIAGWTYNYDWADSDGYGYAAGNNTNTTSVLMYSILSNTQSNVEAYSKIICTWSWQLKWKNNNNQSTNPVIYNYLYNFDNIDAAESTVIHFSTDDDGQYCRMLGGRATDEAGSISDPTASADFTFDNSTGSTDKDITTYLMLAAQTRGTSQERTFTHHWWMGAFKSQSDMTLKATYYYKYLSFNANGGTGTAMADQTIENSGTLAANSYTRTGFKFVGWNTQADGKGISYTDGQSITATHEDKGPVTLYAQWAVDVTVSESCYATVFFDKNFFVPDGIEVYGFTYSDGALVQGSVISEGDVLPANSGYLVKASAAGIYTFVTTSAAATVPASDITGTTTEISTPQGDVYVWSKPEGYNYGWYKYTGATIPAGKAYYIIQQ